MTQTGIGSRFGTLILNLPTYQARTQGKDSFKSCAVLVSNVRDEPSIWLLHGGQTGIYESIKDGYSGCSLSLRQLNVGFLTELIPYRFQGLPWSEPGRLVLVRH